MRQALKNVFALPTLSPPSPPLLLIGGLLLENWLLAMVCLLEQLTDSCTQSWDCQEVGLVELIQEKGASVLDRIITIDESEVSMHSPTITQPSKQWLKKGTPGPVKVKVHDARTKTMVLTFFDS